MNPIHYRPDIDGLRAVAILSVVFYHLDVLPFSGGYIGVDVFFVISGYLITTIIYKDIRNRSFSFLNFYERRIRRIFPALFAVFLITTIVCYFLFLPKDLQTLFQSLVAATLFTSNLLFWKTAGYFGWPAELKPLLHTWSLSIEEQFYIVYPALLLLLSRLTYRWTNALLAGVALISLFLSEYFLYGQSPSVFYLLHFRAWELLIGGLLAIGLIPAPSWRLLRELMSLLGLGLIAYSVFKFTDQTIFPGVKALYPCLGAALIIHADSNGRTYVGKILSFGPLLAIGLISYSLYLWHWPLIVLAKYYAIRPLFAIEKMALLGISLLIATFSWRYIERPFRGKSGILSRKWLFGAAGLTMAGFVCIGLIGHIEKGFPGRLPESAVEMAEAWFKIRKFDTDCIDVSLDRVDSGQTCKIGNPAGTASFIVWGDSHAFSMAEAIDMAAERSGRSGLLYAHSSCPPLIDVERFNSTERGCGEFNNATREWLEKNRNIRTVFLVARWAISAEGTRYGTESGSPVVFTPGGVKDNPRVLKAGLEKTLRFLDDLNIKAVFVNQVPEIGWNVPSTLAREQLFDHSATNLPPTRDAYQKRQYKVASIVYDLTRQYSFKIVDVAKVMCPQHNCLIEKNGRSLYKDDDHLSVYGASLVSDLFMELFQEGSTGF